MKKSDSLQRLLARWDDLPPSPLPRELHAFMECFHNREFYEAHDVLEHLWLRCFDANRSFLQGLIQIAGAFVHFQKNLLFPRHPTHSRRVAPGRRLLELAQKRLAPFETLGLHLGVHIPETLERCALWAAQATQANPLFTDPHPSLPFLPCSTPNPHTASPSTPPLTLPVL